MKLDIYKSGLASFEQMEKLFSKPDSKSWQDMQSILQQKSAETISYAVSFNIHHAVGHLAECLRRISLD